MASLTSVEETKRRARFDTRAHTPIKQSQSVRVRVRERFNLPAAVFSSSLVTMCNTGSDLPSSSPAPSSSLSPPLTSFKSKSSAHQLLHPVDGDDHALLQFSKVRHTWGGGMHCTFFSGRD
jgi:hypothetical protein